MAIYIDSNKRIKEIFVNVNGLKKEVSSVWINRDSVRAKVFPCGKTVPDDIGWNYTLDNQNNTITLNYYTGAETDVVVHSSYTINGKKYRTQFASNDNENGYKPYMFNLVNETIKTYNLKSIIFENGIDTSNVTSMNFMFAGRDRLTSLDLSCFDTSNVTSMIGMFKGCGTTLKSSNLNINSFHTSKVTNMRYMFSGCGFKNLDLSSLDTSNVTDMSHMFHDLSSEQLTILDLCNIKTYKVTDMSYMFHGSQYLQKVYVTSNYWYTGSADKTNMFTNCGTSSVTYK